MPFFDITQIRLNLDYPINLPAQTFERVKSHLPQFIAMLYMYPIPINTDNTVIGGNNRILSLQKLNYGNVPGEWFKSIRDVNTRDLNQLKNADNINEFLSDSAKHEKAKNLICPYCGKQLIIE